MGEKSGADIVLTEIGGTTGDIESQPFLEAIRQVSLELGRGNCLFIHVSLVPYIKSSGEHKPSPRSIPSKNCARWVSSRISLSPVRTSRSTRKSTDKIALFCNVKPDCVIENLTMPILYQAPVMLEEHHFSDIVCRELNLNDLPAPDMTEWNEMLARIENRSRTVRIALVGKYVRLHDAYLSVAEALRHGGFENSAQVDIDWVDSSC